MTVLRRARYTGSRARQTVRSFDNGWRVLTDIAKRSDELTFRTGTATVECPNVPGARVPVYEVFVEDVYELDWFCAGLGTDFAALDIGAHIGCFTVDLATRFPQARVTAFEPTPSTGGYLERNVAGNHLTDRVTVYREAVDGRSGTLRMADNGVGSGHNGVLHLGADGATAIDVPARGVVEVFDGGPFDVVKMDAEGAEYAILDASPAGLWSSVQRVVLEYHPLGERTFADIERALGAEGLSLARRIHAPSGLGLAWFSRTPLP